MAAVTEAALAGFRGGVAARRGPLEFGDEQWARLHGFVVEDGGVLRSQWPLHRINQLDDLQAFGVYQGPTEVPFIVAIRETGAVVWRQAPSDDVEAGADELNEAWHALVDEEGDPITVSTQTRALTTIPLDAAHLEHASGGLRPALMLNTIHLGDSADVWFVYESDNPATEPVRLRAMTLGSSAMWPTDDETEASPKAQHGLLWSGVLVLGDIEWRADPDTALSSSNKTRYRNGLWMSIPGEPLLYDPLSVLFIGSPSTHITGLVETEQGLLVFTNSDQGRGGVHILRGTPDSFVLEPLQLGLGITEGVTRWTDTSTVCWVNAGGEVWQTDSDTVKRLDRQGLGTDRQNPLEDGVQAYGPWMLAARERRLFVLRALDDGRTAAWTELNTNGVGLPDLRFAEESGQSLYFKAGKTLVRFTRADTRTGVSERGQTPSGLVDLSIGSRTLATGEGHRKTYWHRVGVRASSGRRGTIARLEKLVLKAGPVLDQLAPSLERVGPWDLSVEGPDEPGTFSEELIFWDEEEATWDGINMRWGEALLPLPTHSPKRWQAIVRGIGASAEFSIEAIFRGDVQVEQLSVFLNGSILGGDEEGR